MKFSRFLLVALMLILWNQSYADTFERIEIVGANQDGSRISVIRSHFGPSSYAPFVQLQVLEGKSQTPLFEKGYSAVRGDELSVTEMRDKLLNENDIELTNLGIAKQFNPSAVDAFATDFDNQFLVSADIYQAGQIARYNFFLVESQSTCEGSSRKPLAFRVCSLYEDTPTKCTVVEPYGPNGLGCYASKMNFSRMVRIGSYVWFHLFVRTEPLEGLYFYSQVLHGERAP
jgi:hypothetical protein